MSKTIEVQKSVLGMILLSQEFQEKSENVLKKQYFTDERCASVFRAITHLQNEKKTVDIVTVVMLCRKIEPDLSPSFITELTNPIGAEDQNRFVEYCMILQDEHMKREAVLIAQNIITFSIESGSGIETVLNAIKQFESLMAISWAVDNVADNKTLIKKASESYTQRALDAINGIPAGITTGSAKMDYQIGGWQKGQSYGLGGRPGMGKSRSFLSHLRAAAKAGYKPLLFNHEMTNQDATEVMIISMAEGRINPKDYKAGKLTTSELAHKVTAERLLGEHTYFLSSERELSQMKAIARRYVKEKGTQIIFIDFLQKIEISGRYMNPNDRLTRVASEIKNLAKDLDIPIVWITSLSRKVEERGGLKQPELHDCRESGSIESEADMLLFAWFPKYYNLQNPDTNENFTNEFYYLHGKGRFTDPADIIFYADKYHSNFYDEPFHIPQETYEQKTQSMKPNFSFDEQLPEY